MFKTPVIPNDIRNLKAPLNFKNPFQIGIEGPNLFGTETMCGDWDGDLLLLAQDFAPAEEVLGVMKMHGSIGAWRHNDNDGRYGVGFITNENLCRNLGYIGRHVDVRGGKSLDCGVLFGNASFFLKEGNTPPANGVKASRTVFDFVLNNMPNLRAIACLGRPAFDGVSYFLGVKANWRSLLNFQRPLKVGHLDVFALSHPGQLGINGRLTGATNSERLAAIKSDWEAVGKVLA